MTDLLRDLRECVDSLCAANDVYAVTLQVCDRAGDLPRIFQMLNSRGLDEAGFVYEANHVFVEDPFCNVELNEQSDIAFSDAPLRPSDSRIERQRAQCGRYWSFLDQFELDVEAVSTRRLRRGVYTIAGFLRRGSRGGAPLPTAMLTETSTILHNMMGAELLRGTMQTNAGFMGFQQAMELPATKPVSGPVERLSMREVQVAKLVGMGRQTKQVAYELGVSEHTIENHLRRIYGKLGIHNRVALSRLIG